MKKNSAIEQLPDFPSIKQIQGALWGVTETRGAAVLVGDSVAMQCSRQFSETVDTQLPVLFDMHEFMNRSGALTASCDTILAPGSNVIGNKTRHMLYLFW